MLQESPLKDDGEEEMGDGDSWFEVGGWLYSKLTPNQTEVEGRTYRRWTFEEISMVLEITKQGVPPSVIGRQMGMARQTVHNIIKRNK